MATTQEAIARLRMIFETQGADAAVTEMKKLEASSTSLGTSSLNLDRAFGNLERRYNETARATFEYERSMKTLNAALAQNPALAERAAAVTQSLTAKYQAQMATIEQARTGHTTLGVGMQAMAAQASAASASTGILGAVLQTFGKGGAAAAIAIGAVVLAVHKLSEGVHATAQYARDLKNFADATGLTTSQIQGLNKEASRFGIGTDEMRSSLMRFTSTFEEVRSGGGALLEIIRKIDSGLGEQALSAANEEEALNVLAAAYRKAGDEFQRARLLRAAFGRGGAAMGPLIENLDLDKITDKYAGRGLSENTIDQLKLLEGEIKTIGGNVSNRIYSLFAVPWLEAEKAVLQYADAITKDVEKSIKGPRTPTVSDLPALIGEQQQLIDQVEELQSKMQSRRGTYIEDLYEQSQKAYERLKLVSGQIEELQAKQAAKGGGLTSGEPPFEARAKDAQLLVQTLGDLATAQERVLASTYQLEIAYKALGAEGKARIDELRESLEALMQVRAEMSQVEPGTYQRQLEELQALKAEYPGLVAQDAQRVAAMGDQLRIAQAVTGVQRLQVQQEVTYTQLKRQGVAPELAMTMAKHQSAIAQAQINTQAQQQLITLQNQAGLAAAVSGRDKIRAQELATINTLLQQGVDLETATAIAAQERANAEAQVKAQIENQIASLNESTELIYAQIRGNELNVKVRQAYNRAIREGADAETAAALAAATYNNLIAQRALKMAQIAQQWQPPPDDVAPSSTSSTRTGLLPGAGSVVQEIEGYANAGSAFARQFLSELQGSRGAALLASPDLVEAVAKMRQEAALAPQLQQYQQTQEQAQQQLKQLQDQYRLGAAGTPQEKAQIQAQITYEDLIKSGVASDLAHQIANQELANAMQDLTQSVDENTSALQDQLDPIYTEGRAALRIGYYGEGSSGTARTVTGTGYANDNVGRAGGGSVYGGRAYVVGERGPELFVPGASGTIVPNAAPRGTDAAQSGNVIIINNNFPPGAVMGDRRTQYQAANSYGRAISAVGA
jgi:hypothetical protein